MKQKQNAGRYGVREGSPVGIADIVIAFFATVRFMRVSFVFSAFTAAPELKLLTIVNNSNCRLKTIAMCMCVQR